MLTGSCLCGGVRYAIDGELGAVTNCHCSLCRKMSGSAFASGAVDPAWPLDGRAVRTGPLLQQTPALVSDGAGGAVITWLDARGGTGDIYAQHVLASGAVELTGTGYDPRGEMPEREPMVPPVVSPMCGTSTSAPACAIARAWSSSKT